jgi:hypothetical protein
MIKLRCVACKKRKPLTDFQKCEPGLRKSNGAHWHCDECDQTNKNQEIIHHLERLHKTKVLQVVLAGKFKRGKTRYILTRTSEDRCGLHMETEMIPVDK